MIDSLPSSSSATPPAPCISAAQSLSSAVPETEISGSSNDIPTSPQQASFATTLQSRLKAMAVNKETLSKAVATDAADAKSFQAALTAALMDQGKVVPAAALTSVPGGANEALKGAAKDAETKAADEDKDEDKLTLLSTEPPAAATAAPIALPVSPNVVVTTTTLATNGTTTTEGRQPHDSSSQRLVTNNRDADAATTAILAAPAEKSSQESAKVADATGNSGNSTFSDLLKTSMDQTAPHQIQAAPQALTTTATARSREVVTPMAAAAWGTDVGNQLTWMVNQRESRADLVLNPPDLGRIEVSITLNGDQASASFVSANPEVRDALQGSLPRLREVLADAGVFLGQANIGAESFSQNGNGAEKGRNSPGDSFSSGATTLLGSSSTAVLSGSPLVSARGRGLIDLFV